MKTKYTELSVMTGIIEKHHRGFGFLRREEGADIFIAPDNMNGAMSGDLVEVDLLPSYLWTKSKEGIVTKVLERKTTEIVGTFQKSRQHGFVVPDDIGGRFSVLTAVGLLPIAVAGIDIDGLMKGAADAMEAVRYAESVEAELK